jgi:hypothetical protein
MIVYVSGRYSGDIDTNIQKAREAAIELWERGFVALCPHLNTAHFERDCKVLYATYIAGDLELLEKCHAVLMLKGWKKSRGATMEFKHACKCGIPIFEDIETLVEMYAD